MYLIVRNKAPTGTSFFTKNEEKIYDCQTSYKKRAPSNYHFRKTRMEQLNLITNDRIVFRQESRGWEKRLLKFVSARLVTMVLDMLLAFLLVQSFPGIIGQFVNNDLSLVNAIATLFSQVLVIVLNYVLSKLFVFNSKK